MTVFGTPPSPHIADVIQEGAPLLRRMMLYDGWGRRGRRGEVVNMDRQSGARGRREKEKSSKNKLPSINHRPGWPR